MGNFEVNGPVQIYDVIMQASIFEVQAHLAAAFERNQRSLQRWGTATMGDEGQ